MVDMVLVWVEDVVKRCHILHLVLHLRSRKTQRNNDEKADTPPLNNDDGPEPLWRSHVEFECELAVIVSYVASFQSL